MHTVTELIHAIDDGNLPDAERRNLLVAATGIAAGAGLLAAAYPFAASLQPSEAARAEGGPVQADISTLAVGVCTHLGCSPTLRLDDSALNAELHAPGGFFCPCHGSRFDLAGRVVKNVPAPINLEIPPYHFMGDSQLQIG